MIAHDLPHRYMDENEIHTDSLYELAILASGQVVVQCPALCYIVHHLADRDTAVVMVVRNVTDIVASQERVRWGWERLERLHYPGLLGSIAEIKYRQWQWQKRQILHAYEVRYESLIVHPLWISKDRRLDFDAWQTELEDINV